MYSKSFLNQVNRKYLEREKLGNTRVFLGPGNRAAVKDSLSAAERCDNHSMGPKDGQGEVDNASDALADLLKIEQLNHDAAERSSRQRRRRPEWESTAVNEEAPSLK